MQVQKISNAQNNNQNFKGKIDIIPGDLSYLPAKYVRKAYNAMEEQIKDKPFDLFIRQNHKNRTVTLTVQKEKDALKNTGIRTSAEVSQDADDYESVSKYLINEHEEKIKNSPKTFGEKLKGFFKKVEQRFLEAIQDEDEI